MRARRLGRVFGAEMGPSWMASHAAYPAPVRRDDGSVRVYFVTRDDRNRGQVAWVDVDAADPLRVLAVAGEPALRPGATGEFDEAGVAIGCVVSAGGTLRLYYMGWHGTGGHPFRNAIGVAVSDDGDVFSRFGSAPVVAPGARDPFSLGYPFVYQAGPGWEMIYGSHRGPGTSDRDMDHALMHATSDDGFVWRPTGLPPHRALLAPGHGELGLSRPWIVDWHDERHLLFSIRRRDYTVGSARRAGDGSWIRANPDLLGKGDAGWECEASCYASHIRIDGRDLLFYCGNNYGRTGFGVADLCA